MKNKELIKELREMSRRQRNKGYKKNADLVDEAIRKINWYRSIAETMEEV